MGDKGTGAIPAQRREPCAKGGGGRIWQAENPEGGGVMVVVACL